MTNLAPKTRWLWPLLLLIAALVPNTASALERVAPAHRVSETTVAPKNHTGLTTDSRPELRQRILVFCWKTASDVSVECNLYSYAGNNPVNFVDPSGTDIEILVGGSYTKNGKEHPYGHVAIRVHGDGYDGVFDFGRYGRVWGIGGSEGEGIMRMWNDSEAYLQGERATGRTTTGYNFSTTPEQDMLLLEHFERVFVGSTSKEDPYQRPMRVFKLSADYDALKNNCTTVSMDGFSSAIAEIDLNDSRFNQGRGLGFLDKTAAKAAGWPEQIFMPFDLQEKLESLLTTDAANAADITKRTIPPK